MSTLCDVAAAAGVSASTVSRVLNGKDNGFISEATAERVRQAAAELDYRPSAAARSLVTGHSKIVAFCCHAIYDTSMAELLRAVHDATRGAGYHMLLVDNLDTEEIQGLLVERQVDAVLWTSYPIHEADALTEHIAAPHQTIIALGEIEGQVPRNVHSAYWEDRQGMRLLLDHLATLGHTHVAYLGGSHQACPSKRLAFEHGCSELGLRGDVILVDDEADRIATGAAMVSEVLSGHQRPTALLARQNDFAIGALDALQSAGLAVPGDMSVTGYHDSLDIVHTRPPLTTVRTPELEAVSVILPEILAGLGDDPDPGEPTSLRLDLQLVVRQSTSAPRGAKTAKG